MSKLKPFKIRRKQDLTVFGVAVRSLAELKSKGCRLLKLNFKDLVGIALTDGARVDDEDYLMSLDSNTILVFESSKDEGTAVSSISEVLKALRMDKGTVDKLLELAKFITDKTERSCVVQLAHRLNSNASAETRLEDPDWFKRVPDVKVSTKSDVLETSAMNRVRSYYYEAKNHIREAGLTAAQQELADSILEEWWATLKNEKMYRFYFSRAKRQRYTFCDKDGWFLCEGDYQSKSCPSLHSINPYASAEQRAIFSQWNLDHQIEKSRAVLPKMISLLRLGEKRHAKVNWHYFYHLLFTRRNIKLVHIACHIKQEHHEALLDDSEIFK